MLQAQSMASYVAGSWPLGRVPPRVLDTEMSSFMSACPTRTRFKGLDLFDLHHKILTLTDGDNIFDHSC